MSPKSVHILILDALETSRLAPDAVEICYEKQLLMKTIPKGGFPTHGPFLGRLHNVIISIPFNVLPASNNNYLGNSEKDCKVSTASAGASAATAAGSFTNSRCRRPSFPPSLNPKPSFRSQTHRLGILDESEPRPLDSYWKE